MCYPNCYHEGVFDMMKKPIKVAFLLVLGFVVLYFSLVTLVNITGSAQAFWAVIPLSIAWALLCHNIYEKLTEWVERNPKLAINTTILLHLFLLVAPETSVFEAVLICLFVTLGLLAVYLYFPKKYEPFNSNDRN